MTQLAEKAVEWYLLNKGRLAVWIDEVGRSGVKSSG